MPESCKVKCHDLYNLLLNGLSKWSQIGTHTQEEKQRKQMLSINPDEGPGALIIILS